MIEWNIQGRAHACQACCKPFTKNEAYHTLLFDERHGYTRLDVCESCWKSQYSQGASDRKGFVSHWQGVYAPPAPPPPEPIQKETAETLLRRLVELNDIKYLGACFILAVMLERKRLLKVRGQDARDGRRVFVYEHAKSGEVFTIVDPQLHLNQLEAVQRDVAHLLAHGAEPPPPPSPAGATDGPGAPPPPMESIQGTLEAQSVEVSTAG